MCYITITTDFGLKDGFTGVLKGVIWSICPDARIADISHSITPQNILEGAFALWRAYSFFPDGTIHMAVVDPGVGTQRRPIVAHLGNHYFVGPDNGLFTPMYEDAKKNGWGKEIIHLTNEKYFLADVSRTFHGRDIFAPVAAFLAKGIPLAEFGPTITDPVWLSLPKPEKTATGWHAHIMAIDNFGNLTTDLQAKDLSDQENVIFQLHGREIRGLAGSYGQKQSGNLIALVDSEDFIEIAVVNDSAGRILGASIGDVIKVNLESKVE